MTVLTAVSYRSRPRVFMRVLDGPRELCIRMPSWQDFPKQLLRSAVAHVVHYVQRYRRQAFRDVPRQDNGGLRVRAIAFSPPADKAFQNMLTLCQVPLAADASWLMMVFPFLCRSGVVDTKLHCRARRSSLVPLPSSARRLPHQCVSCVFFCREVIGQDTLCSLGCSVEDEVVVRVARALV